ncbi:OLC1v1001099C3 [Oldenlandia corymbosa var. corymbosa]|nr:OLC1v1001099C3 [Oldenlandia corymbosa var. corymbosa]
MGFSASNHLLQFRLLCSSNDPETVKGSSKMSSEEQADSLGKDNHQKESLTTSEVLKKLKRYGVSGVLSYGLLNTAYYLSTFLFVWLYVAPVPGKMGYVGAAERLLKVLAMVWAGSQVTKLIRAGG